MRPCTLCPHRLPALISLHLLPSLPPSCHKLIRHIAALGPLHRLFPLPGSASPRYLPAFSLTSSKCPLTCPLPGAVFPVTHNSPTTDLQPLPTPITALVFQYCIHHFEIQPKMFTHCLPCLLSVSPTNQRTSGHQGKYWSMAQELRNTALTYEWWRKHIQSVTQDCRATECWSWDSSPSSYPLILIEDGEAESLQRGRENRSESQENALISTQEAWNWQNLSPLGAKSTLRFCSMSCCFKP